jgi:hypothetical protein
MYLFHALYLKSCGRYLLDLDFSVRYKSSLSVAPSVFVTYNAWNPNDNYAIECEFFL